MQYQKISSKPVSRRSNPGGCQAGSVRMDRRNHKRFELQATAHFSWTGAAGEREQAEGRTRDVSEMGMFVLAPKCPPSGAAVRLELRASALSSSGLVMQTRGQVVRVEARPEPAGVGFAVATRSLKLRNCKPAVTGPETEYQPGPAMTRKSWSIHSRKPN
jgi:PilZ domain-containing protein